MKPLDLNERILLIFKRKEKGFTIDDLSKEIHMSKSNLSRIEKGSIAVFEETKTLLENYFSIAFSVSEEVLDKAYQDILYVNKRMIFYDLFNQYSREQFEKCCNKSAGSVAYPLYMLLKLHVYTTKNIEPEFCHKYLPIFESMESLFNDFYRKIIFVVKFSYYYFNKFYNEAIIMCEKIECDFEKHLIIDSYVQHIKAMTYICLGDVNNAIITIDKAYKLSEEINNTVRLIAINILRANVYRISGQYGVALEVDEANIKFAAEKDVHIYDYAMKRNIGWTYYLMSDYKNAVEYYQIAEEIDIDDDLCFMTAYSSFCLSENTDSPSRKHQLRNQCRDYLEKGIRAKNSGIAFPFLIEWLELMLKKKYSMKAEKKLLYCLKKHENTMHVDSRNNIYKFLINHYEYHNDIEKVEYYRKKLMND